MLQPPRTHITLAPFLGTFRAYRWATLWSDMQAGATVAVFAVPQLMAYAIVAGAPPVNGLYAALVMSVVAALWGSSNFLNTGPTNSVALMTAVGIAAAHGSAERWWCSFIWHCWWARSA